MKRSILLFSALTCLFTINNVTAQKIQKKEKTQTLFNQKLQTAPSPDNLIRCGSTEYEMANQARFKQRANTEGFEKWLAPKIEEIKKAKANGKSANVVLTIPVVVHILHNNEAVGTGTNLSNLRVQSQITVLNQDYRRMAGTNGYNTNAVGADVEIEFCLAQQDPDGAPSNGIDRVYTGQLESDSQVDNEIKPRTIWNPNKYLNIWVGSFGETDLLGYAYFPDTNVIPGISGLSSDPSQDGLVINCYAFGSNQIAPNSGTYYQGYNRGRTTTHEMGHFLGLRHIWGDSTSCTVNATDSNNDYCLDTPAAADANYSCTAGLDSCPNSPGLDMIENFMDYTPDACSNVFTVNQKERIRAVLANAPRRLSLTTSNACTPGQVYNLNGGIKFSTTVGYCDNTMTPKISLKNSGSTTLTAAVINYTVNGASNTYNWTGSLPTNQTVEISLPVVNLVNGNNTVNATLQTVNGAADQFSDNNTATFTYQYAGTVAQYNTTSVKLTLQRDIYPNETIWALLDGETEEIVQMGQYSAWNQNTLPPVLVINIPVSANNCYVFAILDTEGDGICCRYGAGSYRLETQEGMVIKEGAQFADYEEVAFKITTNMGTADHYLDQAIKLFPNPAENTLNVKLDLQTTITGYQINNQLGQVVKTNKSVLSNEFAIDVANLAKGVYFINFNVEGVQKTMKFIKN